MREYYRPNSVDDALALLTEQGKERKPLGGGTSLSRQAGTYDLVDLQAAGMDQIDFSTQLVTVGAMVRLDVLLSHTAIHAELKRAIQTDASENIRNMATLAGWLVSSDGRSTLTTALLAIDALLTWEPGEQPVRLGDWLALRARKQPGVLISEISWQAAPKLVFEYVARSPKDRPFVVVAVAQWGSGRTRVALGGFGEAPILAMDGLGSTGVDIASRDAFYEAEDQWASAEYRREVAAKLATRCVERLQSLKESEA